LICEPEVSTRIITPSMCFHGYYSI
jgi:hypothetical protein